LEAGRARFAAVAEAQRADRAEAYGRIDPAGLGVFDVVTLACVLSGRRTIPADQRDRWAELLDRLRRREQGRLASMEQERERFDRRQAPAAQNLLRQYAPTLETACRLEASARRSVQRTIDLLAACRQGRPHPPGRCDNDGGGDDNGGDGDDLALD
jgi:hypothetical protein